MPELPEVETVKRGLEKQITGKTIKKVFAGDKKLRIPYPKNLEKDLSGKEILKIDRRSKYLVISLNSKKYLIIHLGMSGRILFKTVQVKKWETHDHFALTFTDNSQIIFNDPRRFGLVTLLDEKELKSGKLFKDLGAEPLSDEFNGKFLAKIFKDKKQPVKLSLMDARNFVGVGNIYASEALFRTGISPKKPAGKIREADLEKLSKNIKKVLNKAIKSGGSTLRDYVRSDGDVGYFQHSFKVYGRENQPCLTCKSSIKRIVQQGRSTYYCPECQK